MSFRELLIIAGIDIEAENITIGLPPGGIPAGKSFGVVAAQALIDGEIDGFWANGMGAEVAVTSGIAKCVLDVRRGDGPAAAFHFTQPALATTQKLVDEKPEIAAGAVRAIVKTLEALKDDVSLATKVAEKMFPAREAGLIATLIERDLPYYDAALYEENIAGMNGFAQAAGCSRARPCRLMTSSRPSSGICGERNNGSKRMGGPRAAHLSRSTDSYPVRIMNCAWPLECRTMD